jgi:imidazolonepropionase-like amidohydrolase
VKRAALTLPALLFAVSVRAETVALVNGTVHPIGAPVIAKGTVVLAAGRIAAVGVDVAVPAGARVVDVSGRHVYPSLFAPVTAIGLMEIGAVRETLDITEFGEINPEARADLAVNFDSELLPVTRSGGVLIAAVTPAGGIVSGSAAVMKLDGWTREDSTVKAPAAIAVTWPNLRIDRSPTTRLSVRLQEKRRDENVRRLKEVFADARAYARARATEGKAGVPRHDFDPKLEALVPAVEKRIPVVVSAPNIQQIRAALAWAKVEDLRLVLADADDAWRIADELARADVPVIVDTLTLPARADEPYDTSFAAAGLLAKAGVRVAFKVGGPGPGGASFVRNLAHQASMAVGFGLAEDKALEAITLEPARIYGVDDRVGSIAPGKDATVIVTDGDVLDIRSRVVAAFVDGRELDLSDRHKRLYERYRNRPKVEVRP